LGLPLCQFYPIDKDIMLTNLKRPGQIFITRSPTFARQAHFDKCKTDQYNIPMPLCNHQTIVLLAPQGKKLRCRHCHLTINKKELADDYCPECYEVYGVKRRDFEQLEPEGDNKTRYSCEKCGAIILV